MSEPPSGRPRPGPRRRPWVGLLAAAAMLALLAGQAGAAPADAQKAADDLPNYRQNAYCESQAPSYEASARAQRLSECKTFEASSRLRLSRVWSSIPPAVKAACQQQMSSLSDGSYFLLSICVVREVSGFLRSMLAEAASDFPRYDQDVYCAASAETLTGDSRTFILSACLENERASRVKLDRVWNEVPKDIKAVCGKQMDAFKDGSYFLLSICIVSEVAKRWLDTGGAIN